MTAASIAPSLDYEALTTSLLLLIGAISAVVAGAWRGWQSIKKSLRDPTALTTGTDERIKIISATIVETASLTRLTDSNMEVKTAVCDLHREVDNLINEMKAHRHMMQAVNENTAELVAATKKNSRVIEETGIKL